MAAIDEYKRHVQQLLREYADLTASSEIKAEHDVEAELVFDSERDHYQVLDVGWQNGRRVYGCALHIDIKDGKLRMQHSGTEMNMAEELVKLGVSLELMVLGFQPEYTRQRSGFVVNQVRIATLC